MDLNSSVTKLPLVGPSYSKKLEKLQITTIGDLLHHVPSRFLDFNKVSKIAKIEPGEGISTKGTVISIKNVYTRYGKRFTLATLDDEASDIQLVWFNQTFLTKSISEGDSLAVAGKVGYFSNKKSFISPEWEKLKKGQNSIHTKGLVAVYPETAGVSSKWLRKTISVAYQNLKNNFEEFLPEKTLDKYNLCNYKKAISEVHFPKNNKEFDNGKYRLAFNELLFMQLKSVYRKIDWRKNSVVHQLKVSQKDITTFIKLLPFELTKSQLQSINEISDDLNRDFPMNRLLEGDVGSGKTVVAAFTFFVAFVNGFQAVIMAPTQILAQQHYETLKQLFKNLKIRITLATSSGIKSDLGKSDIFVGTHTLLHNKVAFDRVAVVAIDEQHRFGVEQRASLVKKAKDKHFAPHILTMTATPIPRTIALSLYGNLDLSTLTELPKGRIPITTWVVPDSKRPDAFKWIADKIQKEKDQVFIVCPLIEESQKETMASVKAATQEFGELKKYFKKVKMGLLHGRLKSKEKEKIIQDFRLGKVNILVTTPVVEVGVDIPNATIMVIEAADRFGLAQLHQLRGRVGRGDKKSYCLIFSQTQSQKAAKRLSALTKMSSGFELAQLDLDLRGPGEILGIRQHGFSTLKIASFSDYQMIKNTKDVAEETFKKPKTYKKLYKKIVKMQMIAN